MDPTVRVMAEAAYVQEVGSEDLGQLYTDDELVSAGDVACDAWDGKKPLRGVLVDVAEELPRIESAEAVAILAGYASGSFAASTLQSKALLT